MGYFTTFRFCFSASNQAALQNALLTASSSPSLYFLGLSTLFLSVQLALSLCWVASPVTHLAYRMVECWVGCMTILSQPDAAASASSLLKSYLTYFSPCLLFFAFFLSFLVIGMGYACYSSWKFFTFIYFLLSLPCFLFYQNSSYSQIYLVSSHLYGVSDLFLFFKDTQKVLIKF